MKKKIAKKWVKALRSGKYERTTFVLNRKNKTFCCLGVLCEIAIEEGVKIKKGSKNKDDRLVSYDGLYTRLPKKVIKWAGLQNEYASFKEDAVNLATLNDTPSCDFNKIADVIDENYKLL